MRAIGVVGDDGSVDYSLAPEVLAVAKGGEYLKNAASRFAVQEFGDDLREMLGVSLIGVKLEWSYDFETFL